MWNIIFDPNIGLDNLPSKSIQLSIGNRECGRIYGQKGSKETPLLHKLTFHLAGID